MIFSTNSRLRCAGRARGGRCATLQVEEPMGSPQARIVSNAERQSLCAIGGEATGRSWTRLTGLPPSRKPLTITPRTLLTLTTVNMFCQKQFKTFFRAEPEEAGRNWSQEERILFLSASIKMRQLFETQKGTESAQYRLKPLLW